MTGGLDLPAMMYRLVFLSSEREQTYFDWTEKSHVNVHRSSHHAEGRASCTESHALLSDRTVEIGIALCVSNDCMGLTINDDSSEPASDLNKCLSDDYFVENKVVAGYWSVVMIRLPAWPNTYFCSPLTSVIAPNTSNGLERSYNDPQNKYLYSLCCSRILAKFPSVLLGCSLERAKY